MPSLPKLTFVKLTAGGNDFLLLDGRTGLPRPARQLAQELCTRRMALGADGLLVVDSMGEAWHVVHYEPSGSRTFCLNGARCAAAWLVASGVNHTGRELVIYSEGQDLEVHVDCSRLTLDVAVGLSRPTTLESQSVELPEGVMVHGVSVDAGNPQFVVLLESPGQLDDPHLMQRARALRWAEEAFPEGTNVNFVARSTQDEAEWLIRTYERGVEDETLSCGTGVLAAACALARMPSLVLASGRAASDEPEPLSYRFRTRGGEVQRVTFPTGCDSPRVWTTGPVRLLARGELWGDV